MNIVETKKLVKKIVAQTNYVPAVMGDKGIGKTEMFKQIADELEWGYQAIYASSLEGADFMGLVVKDLESGITRYLAPEFLPTDKAVEKGLFPEKGILVLEELNRADTQTIHALYPLLLEKKINNHKIADGWKIAVAMNYDKMQYITNTLDNAALDRLLIIDMKADLQAYIDYMVKTGQANDNVMQFLMSYPEWFCKDEIKDNMEKSPSPRGWSAVCNLINKCDLTEEELDTIMTGELGYEAAATYKTYLVDNELPRPTSEQILNHYNKEVEKMLLDIIEAGRFDILSYLCNKVANEIDINNKDHINSFKEFNKIIPEEILIFLFKMLRNNLEKDDFNALIDAAPDFGKRSINLVTKYAIY